MPQNLSNFPNSFQLCYYATFNHSLEINDPINSLITNFTEIKKISSFDDLNYIKFFYFNKKKIHSILYEEEEIVKIDNLNENTKLKEYFYLSLLISEDSCFINYIYPLDFIRKIKNYQIKNKSLLKKIIIGKIINDLINNYESSYFYDDDNIKDKEELKKLKEDNNMIIENNIETFKTIDINLNKKNFNLYKIDEIYSKIIISLIKNYKFDDFKYIKNIVEQLELESIDITKKIYEELLIELNKNYIKEYMIRCKDDFYNNKKINFNFFFLKYILKDPFYIYNIPFFFETKKNLINLIKKELIIIIILTVEETIKERIEYLLKFIPDSEYYYLKYLKISQIQTLKEILYYYKEFLFDSKKNEIKEIETFLEKNEKNINLDNYLKDFEIAKIINQRSPIIKYLYNLKYINEQKDEIDEKEIKICKDEWFVIEKMIKEKKIKRFKNYLKIGLINYFNDIKNKEILLRIFEEDIYKYFIEENIKYLQKKSNKKANKDKLYNNNSNEIGSTKKKSSTENSGKLFRLNLIFKNYR